MEAGRQVGREAGRSEGSKAGKPAEKVDGGRLACRLAGRQEIREGGANLISKGRGFPRLGAYTGLSTSRAEEGICLTVMFSSEKQRFTLSNLQLRSKAPKTHFNEQPSTTTNSVRVHILNFCHQQAACGTRTQDKSSQAVIVESICLDTSLHTSVWLCLNCSCLNLSENLAVHIPFVLLTVLSLGVAV